MRATTILIGIAVVLLGITLWDYRRHGGGITPAHKTWLLVAGIFLVVSVFLRLHR